MFSLDLDLQSLSKVFTINFFILSIRYLLFAGLAYLIVWVWKKDFFQAFRIQEKFPEKSKLLDEVKFSFSTFIIFGFVGVGIFVAKKLGYTKIYSNIHEYGYAYFLFSIVVAILIHDAYFYFAHRLMHHKWLFKKVHAVHHRSTNPSPWASFSFHPLEAILEAGILPLLVFIMPFHPIAIISFMLFMTLMNVLGHLGVEFYPRWFVRSKWTNWNNTSVHHNMHHQKFNCNYGLYFNWWDKIFGTNHPTYLEEFERITSKRDAILEKNKTIDSEVLAIQK
ncbi:MAG: sterol desaturase family protein [Leptospiraceae bacterium]|nr:sterol desaturase family protein [Leptospiraceae bacterium]